MPEYLHAEWKARELGPYIEKVHFNDAERLSLQERRTHQPPVFDCPQNNPPETETSTTKESDKTESPANTTDKMILIKPDTAGASPSSSSSMIQDKTPKENVKVNLYDLLTIKCKRILFLLNGYFMPPTVGCQ